MKKIVLAASLIISLAGCSSAPSGPTESPRVVTQALQTSAPGWITAFAGSGVRGYSPSGTAALSASLDSPSGLALCPDGALYVSDTGNNRIVKFSGGTMSVVVAAQTTSAGKTYGNLIVNPRAEAPIVTAGQIPGWNIISPAGGWSEIPWVATRPEPLDGEQFFRANPGATGEMDQDVDLNPYAADIDAAGQWFGFSGFVHSLSGDANPDAAQVIVEYRKADGSRVAVDDSGPLQNRGEWQLITLNRIAPVGTRLIRIRLVSTRHTGSGNDAYYDGLLLRAFPHPFGIFPGDGQPATQAMLSLPHGLACDNDGTLYIADTYNGLVRSLDPAGFIHTVAGSTQPLADGDGRATDMLLRFPTSVSINHSVGTPNSSALKLVIADYLSHKIRGLTTSGNLDTLLSGDGNPCPAFGVTTCAYYPMAVSAVGNQVGSAHLIVSNRGPFKIVDDDTGSSPSGSTLTNAAIVASGPGFSDVLNPSWSDSELSFSGAIQHGNTIGNAVAIASVADDPSAQAANPHLVYRPAYTTAESIPGFFVADLPNHAIRHVTANAIVQTVAGDGTIGDSGENGPAPLARFTAPSALAESKDGTLYVADAETNRIRKISCGDVDRCSSNVSYDGASCVWSTASAIVNDANPCTNDICFWTVGPDHQAYSSVVSCSDGNACNGLEQCSGTVCIAGTPLDASASCSDNNACNGTETCDANHNCQPSAPPNVDDGNPCKADSCDPVTGVSHVAVADNTPCTVSDPCKQPGTCQSGTCNAAAIPLTDTNPCVTETCSSTTGVVRTLKTGAVTGGTCTAGVFTATGAASFTLPAIDNTVPPTSSALFASIYDPVTGSQTGVAAGTISPDHAAHLYGLVMDSTKAGLAGVAVTIVNHPELGQTLTRSDGKYDIVVNGGGPVVVRFTKSSFLPADRQATTVWGGGAHIDDVIMLAVDPTPASVALNSATFLNVAVGTAVTSTMDPRGARQGRFIIPNGTTATAVDLSGTTHAVASPMVLHATEYTVGTSTQALARMPAPLPGSSLYTYAVEYSIDAFPNAASVVFNQPVFSYLENFLNFPAGTTVPDGYYDRNKGAWVTEDNGLVVNIVGYNAGAAVIDVTGDGAETAADTAILNALPVNERLTANERSLLATSYPGATPSAPKSLWRMPLTHLCGRDFNLGGGVDCVAGTPNHCPNFDGAVSKGVDGPQAGSCKTTGSIIGTEEQTLGESLPVMGTPYTLEYRSNYTIGYRASRGVEVDFNAASDVNSASSLLAPKDRRVELATPSGSWSAIDPATLNNYITWDGRDSAGRRVNGSQLATVIATMVYKGDYKKTGYFGNSAQSDSVSAGYTTVAGSAPDVYFTRTFKKVVSAWGADLLGFGGWTLSPMHVYDPTSGILYQGDGRERNLHNEASITQVAGNGTTSIAGATALKSGFGYNSTTAITALPSLTVAPNGDVFFWGEDSSGTPALLRKIDALTGNVSTVVSLSYGLGQMALSPDGLSIYVATQFQILKVNLSSLAVQVFAGTGASSQIDGPASQATFKNAQGLAVAPDGTVYVSDFRFVRKIGTDNAHTVSTIAGAPDTSGTSPCVKGAAAKTAGLGVGSIGLAIAADGAVWTAGGSLVTRLDPSGTISCFPTSSPTAGGIAVAADQSVYFGTIGGGTTDYAVVRLNVDGTTTVIAGNQGFTGVMVSGGARAISTKLGSVRSLASGPDGSIYFLNEDQIGAGEIYRLALPVTTGPSGCPVALPSEDGAQTFCFDTNGRHLLTKDTVTGTTLLTFVYTNNLLTEMDDADLNKTTITRGASNGPVVIKGPFGQATTISLNATTNYATSIQDPALNTTSVTHDANGLLQSMTDKNGKVHSFSYDELGRLIRDQDPAGGYQMLNRPDPSTVAGGYKVSDVTALGATSSYAVSVSSQGVESRTVQMQDGSTNQSSVDVSGGSVTTFADGSKVTEQAIPDALWPTYEPYVVSSTTLLPSTLSRTITSKKDVVYTTGTTPTIDTVKETLTNTSLGSASLTRLFKNSTKTYTVTTPALRVGTTTVDGSGRPVTVTPPGVNAINYAYNLGRLSSVTQGTRQTTMTYFPTTGSTTPGLLQRVTVTNGSGLVSTLLAPDKAGRPLSSTTGAATLAGSAYTWSGTPTETDFSWDKEGNALTVTPPGETAHTETYTPVNLLQSYLPPAVSDVPDSTTSFFYNADRSLEYVRQPGGRGVDYVYKTSTGQLTQISAGGASDASFNYYSSSGKLQTAVRGSTTVTLTYDGPLTTGQAWSGTAADAVNGSATWTYDAGFRVKSETVAPAPTTTGLGTASYLYDADGLVTCASLSASLSSCTANTSTMVLTPDATSGALKTTSLGVVTEAYTRNAYGELASFTATAPGSTLAIVYDNGVAGQSRDGFGRVLHQTESSTVLTTDDYTYDDQGRLTQVNENGFLRKYGYDANGNRINLGGATIATYDAQDRMLTYNGASYGYGPNGERRKRTNTDTSVDEYQYDALGNLSHVTRADGVTIDYAVDAFNRRIAKNKNGTTVARYIYRNGLSPVAVLDGTGALVARFVYASRPNTPDFMVMKNGTVYKFVNDQRGSPRAIVNATTGVVVLFYSYDEFGNVQVPLNTGAVPTWAQPFGFAGGLYDEDTQLVRFGARDYEAATGRWLAKDPALFGGGQGNLYMYAGNDPINFRDPSGKYGLGVIPLSGTAEAGVGFFGAGVTGSVGAGVFVNDRTGDVTGGFTASGGYFVGPPSGGLCGPKSSAHAVAGATIGGGPGLFLTNANSVSDLDGYGESFNINAALFGISYSWGISPSTGDYIWQLSFTSGWGPGLSGSYYPTQTVTYP